MGLQLNTVTKGSTIVSTVQKLYRYTTLGSIHCRRIIHKIDYVTTIYEYVATRMVNRNNLDGIVWAKSRRFLRVAII